MKKHKSILVKGTEIAIFQGQKDDYVSLTDIARFKNPVNTDCIIKNCLRNRGTI